VKKVYHRKLVRDKIPQIIEACKEQFETRILDKDEFEFELKKKLVEEAKELQECDEGGLKNELCDVLELIKSIAKHYNIPFKEIQSQQRIKREKGGTFKKRVFLIWSSREQGTGD
jgi:predicted house-cleaning noncanonical NTP pyrophosphatase (MazG superfamily)